jgi:hypothetical protein
MNGQATDTSDSADFVRPASERLNGGGAPNEIFRTFASRMAVLAWAALLVFWGIYATDHFVAPADSVFTNPLSRYFTFQADSNQIAALAGMNAAIFAIVITVASIIVQLTADRYTGVARMFLRDKINVRVAAYYVITCVVGAWLVLAIHSDYAPRATIALLLSLTTGGIVLMMPYFGYVFWFLEPQNLVRRVRQDAVVQANEGALEHDQSASFGAQPQMLRSLEELTDIANNSISGKDKIIACAAVDALKDFALEYLKVKPRASDAWFQVGPQIRTNPDFVAMDPEALADIETRRTWVEWKVMRQYLTIYNEALTSMRDVNYVIAIDTRYLGEAAAKTNDEELMHLVFRFMNSYLRSALNARDVRTVYNVLNQYRKLVSSMLENGRARAAIAGVKHMKYYGLVGFELGLDFVTETVGYDLSALVEHANELKSPAENDILGDFLELDRAPFVRGQDKALMGVRRAQAKLAAYYIMTGQEARARAIANDMRDEPQDRLQAIERQLQAVDNKDFWEIVDRGRNFEWMPAEQRACLATFFGWLARD